MANASPPIYQVKLNVHANGYEVRHDMLGFYICTSEEAEHEDEGNASVGFDGRPHWWSLNAAYRDAYRLHCKALA